VEYHTIYLPDLLHLGERFALAIYLEWVLSKASVVEVHKRIMQAFGLGLSIDSCGAALAEFVNQVIIDSLFPKRGNEMYF
jgi:hypothetical protein